MIKIQTVSGGEDLERLELFYTVGGGVKWCSHSADSGSASMKQLSCELAIPLLDTQAIRKYMSTQNLYTSGHNSIVHNRQNPQSDHQPTKDKHLGQPHNEYLGT